MKKPSFEERLAALEAEVASIPRRGRYVEHHEQKLREHALTFARLTLHGETVREDGARIRHMSDDAKDLAEYHLGQMKSHALGLLRELGVEEEPG